MRKAIVRIVIAATLVISAVSFSPSIPNALADGHGGSGSQCGGC